ncbi:hypothetical protein AS026_01385 [Rhizobium altiplani]|uniref:Uncharacterized protein n=2 Tax=Rhizobium altiplani TaxID=1864509 RepID=A0A109J9G4_9HYPH|nr:hypothetical protein AS026_01385 [Rhizobium altiplani]
MEFDVASIERAFVEAALDPTKWNEAMNAVTIATGCTGAVLFDTGNHLPGLPHSESKVRSLEAYVEGGWIERDVRYGVLSTLVQRGVATDFDIFTPDSISRFLLPGIPRTERTAMVRWGQGRVERQPLVSGPATLPSLGPFTPAQLHSLVNLSGRLGTACAITRTLGIGRIDAALEAFDMSMTAAIEG